MGRNAQVGALGIMKRQVYLCEAGLKNSFLTVEKKFHNI